jgi:nucleotide-binding universal stress UspA family protein
VSRDPLGRTVVVPIVNPASLPTLLTIAGALTGPDNGRIRLVTVVGPRARADEHAHAWQGLAAAEELAERQELTVDGRVVEAEDVSEGVRQAVAEVDASLVVMGWRGASSTHNVFGALIDSIVGRSAVPLAIVRPGLTPPRRVLLPVSADHLLPGGDRGLRLAVDLAQRLDACCEQPITVLRTGPRDMELPPRVLQLGDRVHHDPRRTDQAVAAFARGDDLIVAPVAPTVSGLRAATTHLAWAAPDATLLVAVDVGPVRGEDLAQATEEVARPPEVSGEDDGLHPVRIVVTARLPDDHAATPDGLDRVLRRAGATDHLMAWWPAGDPRPHVRASVTVRASGVNSAISAVMVAVHDAPDLRGAEITYDVDRGAPADVDTGPRPARS